MSKETERSGYHHGRLREALVEQARALVEERGIEQLSLREVARRAGVSRAAPYHHFANKQAMVAAVAEAGFRELYASMRAGPETASEFDRLEWCGRAYIGFAMANPTVYRLMFGSKVGNLHEHPALVDAADCAFGELVTRLVAAVPGEPDPTARAMAVWGAVHGMASLLIDNLGPHDATAEGHTQRWIDASIALVEHGLKSG